MATLRELVQGIGVRTVRLYNRPFEAKLVEGPVQTLVQTLHPMPAPPMAPDPTRGSAAPKVPDHDDPGHLARVAVWQHQVRCAVVALSIEAAQGGQIDDAATETLALLRAIEAGQTVDLEAARRGVRALIELVGAAPEQDVLLAHVALVRPLDQGDVEQARKKS